MRLYLTAAGRWAGTQAEAGKGFEQVEVPIDKPGLLAWLNENAARKIPPACTLPAAAAPIVPNVASLTLTRLEEEIQNADDFRLGRLLDNVVARLEELRREAGIGRSK